jgi:phage-related protein
VAKTVYAVVSGIVGFIRDHWNRIGPIVFGVLNYVKTYIVSYLRVIRDIINVAMALLRGDWGEAWNALKRLVVDAVTGILSTFKAYVTMWRAVLVAGLAALVGVGRNAMAGLLSGIKSGGAAVVGWFAALPQAICEQLVGLYNIMTQFGKLVAEGFIAGLGSLAGAVWQKVKDVFWTPINWAKSMFNVARGFAGGLLAGAGGAQSAIGRVMAVGGIAAPHTGGGSVAHGSSPLGGNSTGLTINILGDIVGVDVDDLTRQIAAKIGLEQRRLNRGLA